MAAVRKHSFALLNLGEIYIDENGDEPDSDKSFLLGLKYIKKAAELKNPEAYFALCEIYSEDNAVGPDLKKAFEYLEKTVELNSPAGCYEVGYAYMAGELVTKDQKMALKYYKMAAQLNYYEAFYELGQIFEDIDIQQAIKYYKQAANNNNINAIKRLYEIYSKGCEEVAKDIPKSIYYLERAALLDDIMSIDQLGDFYFNAQNYSKAKDYYEKLVNLNFHLQSSFDKLGILYLNGLGVPQNTQTAINYYQLANNFLAIGDIYYNGIGIEINNKKAKEYYKKVSNLDIGCPKKFEHLHLYKRYKDSF